MISHRKVVIWVLSVCISLLLLVGCSFIQAESEKSNIDSLELQVDMENLTDQQYSNLQKLCKVWGYVKYYHPDVVEGKIDWDEKLLEVIPSVLVAEDEQMVNQILSNWVGKLSVVEAKNNKNLLSKVSLEPTTGWIHDENYLGKDLNAQLENLEGLYLINREKAPVSFVNGFASFENEKAYKNMSFEDKSLRLLCLFRYWNAVEYYYPYKNIIDENWDDVLLEFIPKFLEGDDKVSYILDIAELSTKIHDPHAGVYDKDDTFIRQFGEYIAPITFTYTENAVVITKVLDLTPLKCSFKTGDVVKKFDGKDIKDVIEEKLKYVSVSLPEKFSLSMHNYLFRTEKEQVELVVERDGQLITEMVETLNRKYLPYGDKPSHQLLENNIGLINPSFLKKDEIHSIMEEFSETTGIIVDLRQYPSDFITYSLAEYLIPNETVFCKITFADQGLPGQFIFLPDTKSGGTSTDLEQYKGKVAILMNEESISNAEFTVMSLRNAPKAKIIGSNSIGTDGNVVEIPLPGDVTTVITGIGIFTPDDGQTQRIGLTPDVYITPTIEGIRAGKDELLDAAVDYIVKVDQ